jgi:cytidine deaminase
MAEEQRMELRFLRHASADDLPEADRLLVQAAVAAAARAYAPYSRFFVGAALRTSTGEVVAGSNQENASFPAGTCAERSALHACMSQHPQARVEVMAIAVPAVPEGRIVSPCGICRQALLEQEHRQGAPMRLLLGNAQGPVLEVASAGGLLPLSFDPTFLEG